MGKKQLKVFVTHPMETTFTFANLSGDQVAALEVALNELRKRYDNFDNFFTDDKYYVMVTSSSYCYGNELEYTITITFNGLYRVNRSMSKADYYIQRSELDKVVRKLMRELNDELTRISDFSVREVEVSMSRR